jgi:hypothetical protein
MEQLLQEWLDEYGEVVSEHVPPIEREAEIVRQVELAALAEGRHANFAEVLQAIAFDMEKAAAEQKLREQL